MVLFVVLGIIAINWLANTHAHPRGKLTEIGMHWASSWTNSLGRLAYIKNLSSANNSLLTENARLRTENLALKSLETRNDTANTLLDFSSWHSIPAEIIRHSYAFNNNILIANKGSEDGVMVGMGMLENGNVAGIVVEITEHEALVFPIIHLKMTWSVRLGDEGAVGRLVWDGEGIEFAKLLDIPRSELVLKGDPIVTSGFQGNFPSGMIVGEVEEVFLTDADKFQSVSVNLSADFYRIRYVEFLENLNIIRVDSLIASVE